MLVKWVEHYGTWAGFSAGTLVADVVWYEDVAWVRGDDGLQRIGPRHKYWVASIVGAGSPDGDPLGLLLGLDHHEWTTPEQAKEAAEEWLATHDLPPSGRAGRRSGRSRGNQPSGEGS
jgi:hypothetical protein